MIKVVASSGKITILHNHFFELEVYVLPLITEINKNKAIEFMFAGINMFWARLRLILARAVRRGFKWALIRAQNIFMPKNINSITIIITLEGIERINTEKMTTKHSEEYFFLLWVNVNKLWNGFSSLIGCLDRTIIWFSLFIGLFQRAKIHFSLPNSSF